MDLVALDCTAPLRRRPSHTIVHVYRSFSALFFVNSCWLVGWLFWAQRPSETVFQSISIRLPETGRKKREMIDERQGFGKNDLHFLFWHILERKLCE